MPRDRGGGCPGMGWVGGSHGCKLYLWVGIYLELGDGDDRGGGWTSPIPTPATLSTPLEVARVHLIQQSSTLNSK